MTRSSRNRLILLFALALGLRWAYALRYPAEALLVDIDARGYHQITVNLLDGRGFSMSWAAPYLLDTIRTPVYPALIAALYALFGRNTMPVVMVQGLIDASVCIILWFLVRRLTKSELAAFIAGALYALNPTALRFSNSLLTETLLTFVLTLLALIFLKMIGADASRSGRKWQAVALGLLCGVAILIKPNVVLLPVIVAACVLLGRAMSRRARLASAGIVLVSALVVVAPWVARNAAVVGRPMLSSAFDDNLSHVSAVATLIEAQGEVVAPWTPRWEAYYGRVITQAAERYGWSSTPPQSTREADARQRQIAAVAREIVREHPGDFVIGHLRGFVRSWAPQEYRFWYEFVSGQSWAGLNTAEGAAGQTLAVLKTDGAGAAMAFLWQERFARLPPLAFVLWAGWVLAYAISAVLLGIGSWRLRRNAAFLCLIWGCVLYLTFLPGPIAYVRFRAPVAPLLIAVMVVGLADWQRRSASKE